jgi:hypothetical protein
MLAALERFWIWLWTGIVLDDPDPGYCPPTQWYATEPEQE